MSDIVQKDNPVLHKAAALVPIEKITSPEIQGIIAKMSALLSKESDGIALAAPQIGQSLRIFVVSDNLLKQADKAYKAAGRDLVFINPEIVKTSKEKKMVEEGCLSVRWLYGKVPRSVRATIKAFDEHGAKIERGASGVLAQIFQHEVDHLNGMLFTDRADELWELEQEEIDKIKKANAS